MSQKSRLEAVSPEQIRIVPTADLADELSDLRMWGTGLLEIRDNETFATVASTIYVHDPERRRISEAYLAAVTDADEPVGGFLSEYFASAVVGRRQELGLLEGDASVFAREKRDFITLGPGIFYPDAVAITAAGVQSMIRRDARELRDDRTLNTLTQDERMQSLGGHVIMVAGMNNCKRIFGPGYLFGRVVTGTQGNERLLTSFTT